MDNLVAIRIKHNDGTYSNDIPLSVLAVNIDWDGTHNLVDVLGNVDLNKGSIQEQINALTTTITPDNVQYDLTHTLSDVLGDVDLDKGDLQTQIDNISDGEIQVDTTLTAAGKAADAKAVGDNLKNVVRVGNSNVTNFTSIILGDTEEQVNLLDQSDLIDINTRLSALEGGDIQTDQTLSVQGMAADAKATGDAIHNLRGLVGTPLTAATAASMTNTDKIYVYTGSEAGYTNGNWYYHNGTSWVSGGVYNSIAMNMDTEPTLGSSNPVTSAGIKAALDAVDDEIDELKENLTNTIIDIPVSTTFVSYETIKSTTGEFLASGSQRRTDYIELLSDTFTLAWNDGFTASDSLGTICFYDANKQYVSGQAVSLRKTDASNVFVIDNTEVKYLAYCGTHASMQGCHCYFSKNSVVKSIYEAIDEKENIYSTSNIDENLWDVGTISAANGQDASSSTALRTAKIKIDGIDKIAAENGYKLNIYGWQGSQYIGFYTGSAFTKQGSALNYLLDSVEVCALLEYGVNILRVVLRKSDQTDININEYTNAYVLSANLQKIRSDIKGIKTVINSVDSPYNHGKYTLKRSNFTKWYSGLQSDYSSFDEDTLYSEVIAAFDALMAQHPDYITKATLGTASGTDAGGNAYSLYEYVFTPRFYSNAYSDIKRPKIYMDGSIHGFEKNSTFGLYYFLKDLAEHWDENETLSALRECVEFHIIPVVNPYGFDRNKYINANGVNLNRNFAHPGEWIVVATPDTEVNGEEAFDQPESQIVRDWLLNDEDSILMYFNCHTNGFTSVGYGEMNACLTSSDRVDDYFNKLFDALTMHLNRQTLMLTKNYQSINPSSGEICGHIGGTATSTSTKGTASAWANTMRSMLAMTLEGFNELSDAEDNVLIANFSDESKKINSEIIGNILAQIITVYSNY